MKCKICGNDKFSYKIDYDDVDYHYDNFDEEGTDEAVVSLVCNNCGNETFLNEVLERKSSYTDKEDV